MRRRMMNLLRAGGALASLAALVLGVPALLVAAVGNPLPAQLPSLDEMQVVLTQNGDGFGSALLLALAVGIWVLWAQVMVALVVEVIAALRRRPAPALPTLPGIQPMVRQLVAALVLSVSLAGAPVLAPALGALHLEAPESESTMLPLGSESTWPAAVEPVDTINTVGPIVVLHERTELWDLAEAAYGDGLAWTEIASANVGVIDANGARLSSSSEAVPAGTSLRMPGSPSATSVAEFGTHIVEPGESLWSIAAAETTRRLGSADDNAVADYWHEVVAANADTPSGNTDLIFPGDEVVLPGTTRLVAAEEVAAEEVVVEELVGEEVVTEEVVVEPDLAGVVDGPAVDGSQHQAVQETIVEPDPVEAEDVTPSFGVRRRGIAAPFAPELPSAETTVNPANEAEADATATPLTAAILGTAGGALLAAGVLGAVRRRRALQWRQRGPQRVPQRPSTEAAAFEAILAEAASQVETSALGNGWVAVSGEAVERVLGAGAVNEIDLRDSSAPHEPEGPPRVTAILGTEEMTSSPLFVGFAPASVTGLDGTPGQIARVAQLLILDLAVSDRIQDVRVIAVGVGAKLGDLERVESVVSWPDACVAAHRLGSVADAEGAIVAVGVTPADPDSLALLNSLGAAAVGPINEAVDRIRVDGNRALIEPAGIEVMLAALPDDDFELVGELVEATALVADEPVAAVEEGDDLPLSAVCPLAPGPVEVRVLGPVEVVGASPFSSVKAVDVVTYLAFHRQGVGADQLKTWVWPSFEPPTDKAFANVMSRARTGLGADDDGVPYLSRAGSDRLYRLDRAVTTDFDRLRGLVDLADDTDEPHQQLMVLQQALELVRGIPFSGGTATSFAWADSQVRSHVEFAIDETVHRCADLALDLGDHGAARAAVRIGLQVVPGCEQCFRRRFLIARADNNRQELRSAMADLERTAAAELGEPEGVDYISRELLILFEELDRDLIAGSS